MSSIVITLVQVAVWPLPSSTIQMIVVSPFGKISPAMVSVPFKSLVMLPLVQLSVKVASNSVPITVYSHSPRSVSRVSSATQIITGSSLSKTVTNCWHVMVILLTSVNDHVTVVWPKGKLAGASFERISPGQPFVIGFPKTTAVASQEPRSLFTIMSVGQVIIDTQGALVSYHSTLSLKFIKPTESKSPSPSKSPTATS